VRQEERIAVVHEWIAAKTGSEKVFEALAAIFPTADLWALTHDPKVRLDLGGREVRTTFLQKAGPLRRRRAMLLPLMPTAWARVKAGPYDLVVSSHHAFANGFAPARTARHFCYVHTPARYIWMPDVDGRGRVPGAGLVRRALKRRDLANVAAVDSIAAISGAVAARIERFWGRQARVIHPPVDTDFFTPSSRSNNERDREVSELPEPYVLVASRFVPYKRLDLAIRAGALAGFPVVVAGSGPEESRLRALAEDLGVHARFEIQPSDERLRRLYRFAVALVFPAVEDFGIVPVEAQACGTPVVALRNGGTLDTVLDGVTGALVDAQDPRALAEGIALATVIEREKCRAWAERFSLSRFTVEVISWIEESRGYSDSPRPKA
jgi:glycosyltransferase involved in cell wall biosynthesis